MKCTTCSQNAVFLKPTLCKKHFLGYVEKKVWATIRKWKLLSPKDKIVVAVSGGKDSLTILSLLNKYMQKNGKKQKNLIALCIDEGIVGYRPSTIEDMVRFCTRWNIPYHIVSYKEAFGKTLDVMKTQLKEKPCTICGAFRRYLLNKKARELGATKLVTGHNADDESQAILMNLARHQLEILPRLGPATGVVRDKQFIPRVKPLYFLTEKEIAAYAFLQDFGIRFIECPNAVEAYRGEIGTLLNDWEEAYPGAKQRIIKQFVQKLPQIKRKFHQQEAVQYCQNCQEPCMGTICKACQLLGKLEKGVSIS